MSSPLPTPPDRTPAPAGSRWIDREGKLWSVQAHGGLSRTSPVTLRTVDGRGPDITLTMEELCAFERLPSGAWAYRYTRTLRPGEMRP